MSHPKPYFLPDISNLSDISSSKPIVLKDQTQDHGQNEDWIQELIHEHPELIPASQIEPMFEHLIPVCRELKLPSGYLDNLYVTPNGYLTLIECKLWKNPQGRREVVGQILDYAKDLSNFSYDDITHAINCTIKSKSQNPLYDCIADHPEALPESEFVDRITQNLKKSRHLLLILGDGIQQNARELGDFLEHHGGLHFTLGMIEMKLFQMQGQNGVFVLPHIQVKTENIVRNIIEYNVDEILIKEPERKPEQTPSTRGRSLTEEEFYKELTKTNPEWSNWLKSFASDLEDRGIDIEVKSTLLPKYDTGESKTYGFGIFKKNGIYDTRNIAWTPNQQGKLDIAKAFIQKLANLFENSTIDYKSSDNDPTICINGKPLTIGDLIPKRSEIINCIEDYIRNISDQ